MKSVRRARKRRLQPPQKNGHLTAAVTCGTALLLVLLSSSAMAAGRPVSFRTDDGRVVNGTISEAGQRPAPAVVLVPMLGRGKDDWQQMADRLADANITALAIDLPAESIPAEGAQLAAWHADIIAAVTYLASRADVRASSIGVAGASLGANLAVLAGAADSRIQSLALVSASLDYRGVRIETPLRQYGGRPALLVASLRDPYAIRSARTLADDAPGIREIRSSETAAHGTLLLSRDPEMAFAVVEWFRRTLG
jgi:dienelactone hydrolase